MEQTRKNLKITSALVLLFAGLNLLEVIAALVFAIDLSVFPAGATEELVQIAKIVIIVISLLFLAPEIYLGVRGLKLAKNPAPAKAPLVWATILFVISLLSLVSPALAIIRQENVGQNVSYLLGIVVEVLIYLDYIKCMKALNKAK